MAFFAFTDLSLRCLLSLLLTFHYSSLLFCFPFFSIQKYVLWTVAHTVFAWGELVAVKKAGRAPHVIREPATRAVPNTGPARMASANAARAGTESTVPSVGEPHFCTYPPATVKVFAVFLLGKAYFFYLIFTHLS